MLCLPGTRLLRYMVASKINLQELQTTQAKIDKPRNKKWIANLSFHRGSWVCMPHAFSDLYHLLRCSLFFSRQCVGEVKVKSNSFAGECKVAVCQHCRSLHCKDQVDHKVYEYRNPWEWGLKTHRYRVQREVSTLPQHVVHNGFKGI